MLFEHVSKDAKHYIPFIKWGNSFSEDIKEVSKTKINGKHINYLDKNI